MDDDLAGPPRAGSGLRLAFGSPLSSVRAERLTGELAACQPATILDVGCGWGTLLLDIAAAVPSARATGVDRDAGDVARGRAAATAAGLADRVEFIEGAAADHLRAADLVLNIGAWHALGTMPQALDSLRGVVNPGGRLLFAAEYWERTPTPAELANMWPDMTVDDCSPLADLVDLTIAAGFRPLRIESVARGEWEEFESGFAAEREQWLLAHPDHHKAAEVRGELDTSRSIWLRGHRDILGFAYLTLGVPA